MKRVIGLFLVLLPALLACEGDQVRLMHGDEAPDFVLEDLNGRTFRLSDYRGKVVAVRFWADWCRFCEGEMRSLEPTYRRLREGEFEMLAVNVGQDRKRVRRFVERLEITYPALLDPDSDATRRYGVIALPTTVVVDKQGRVEAKILGESAPDGLESLVAPLLEAP